MILNKYEFKAVESSLDALWAKQKVIQNNIANYETPGFKSKQLEFKEVLSKEEAKNSEGQVMFQAEIYENNESSIRPDGNNVSMEKESMELWKTYAQYTYLADRANGQIKNMRYVINNALK